MGAQVLLRQTVRDLMSLPRHLKPKVANIFTIDATKFNEEIRSLLHARITKLREIPIEPTAYNVLINTPEFSRFVFAIPATFLVGVTFLSLSPPTTLPLIFEKMIPYHIKTMSMSCAFYAFSDLAVNVIGRPTATSHHRFSNLGFMVMAMGTLLASTTVLSVSDYDPHKGYAASLGLVALSAVPAYMLPMHAWNRVWRLGVLGLSFVSTIAADRKLRYLESNWDDMIFSIDS